MGPAEVPKVAAGPTYHKGNAMSDLSVLNFRDRLRDESSGRIWLIQTLSLSPDAGDSYADLTSVVREFTVGGCPSKIVDTRTITSLDGYCVIQPDGPTSWMEWPAGTIRYDPAKYAPTAKPEPAVCQTCKAWAGGDCQYGKCFLNPEPVNKAAVDWCLQHKPIRGANFPDNHCPHESEIIVSSGSALVSRCTSCGREVPMERLEPIILNSDDACEAADETVVPIPHLDTTHVLSTHEIPLQVHEPAEHLVTPDMDWEIPKAAPSESAGKRLLGVAQIARYEKVILDTKDLLSVLPVTKEGKPLKKTLVGYLEEVIEGRRIEVAQGLDNAHPDSLVIQKLRGKLNYAVETLRSVRRLLQSSKPCNEKTKIQLIVTRGIQLATNESP